MLGLEDIHGNAIIHRDIKPENIVLESTGYARITDFGISRPIARNNSKDTSGTPGYMSPEVILRKNHSYATDFYAVGVILHELMLCRRPYKGKTRKDVREQMTTVNPKLSKTDVPDNWTEDAVDLINKLLDPNQESMITFLLI